MQIESLFSIFAVITGALGIVFWGCLVYFIMRCVQLIDALIRFLDRR